MPATCQTLPATHTPPPPLTPPPLRLLVSTSTFPVALDDGTPRFIYDLADALAEHAHVFVLAPDASLAHKREQMGRLHVTRFSYWMPRPLQRLALDRGIRANLSASWLARVQVPFFLLSQVQATRALVRRYQITVVNAHWLVPQGLTAALARGRSPRFRLILHVHAGDVYFLHNLPGGSTLARFIAARCDAIFAAGSHVRDSLDELLGFASGAVIQPMGVRSDVFGRNGNDALSSPPDTAQRFPDGYLLCVGRMVEKKGMVYLIRALPQIREKRPGIGLLLIGSGPEEPKIREEVDRLNLKDAVVFLGRRSHQEIVRYLHACCVCVVPSIIDSRGETEGMPTIVVEAFAAGVKVVGSRVDGIPDVLRHEDNGWLCREKDPDDLAEKILGALASSRSSSIVQSALTTAAKYDWKQVALNYMDCLRRLQAQEPSA